MRLLAMGHAQCTLATAACFLEEEVLAIKVRTGGALKRIKHCGLRSHLPEGEAQHAPGIAPCKAQACLDVEWVWNGCP